MRATTLRWTNFLMSLAMVAFNVSCAPTKHWVRNDGIGDGQTPSSPPFRQEGSFEERERQEKNTAIKFATSQELGFHSISYSSDNPVGDALIYSLAGRRDTTDTLLILRVICEVPGALIPVNYRYKPVRWNILDHPEIKKELQGGTSRTDAEGFLRLRFNSDGDSRGYIDLDIEEFNQRVPLNSGPFEIKMPEKYCGRH